VYFIYSFRVYTYSVEVGTQIRRFNSVDYADWEVPTVNVQNNLAFCIDESCCFERLNPVIRPATVVLARVFTAEKRRVDGGVTGWLVLLRRQA
jgi:hypothetical protein